MLCYERLHFLQQNHTKNGCSAHKQRWSPIPRFNRCVPTCTTHSFITLLRPPLLLQQRTYQNAIASPNWTCVPLESFICNNRRISAFNALQIRFANLICILAQLKFILFCPEFFSSHLEHHHFLRSQIRKMRNQIHMEKIQMMRHSNLYMPTFAWVCVSVHSHRCTAPVAYLRVLWWGMASTTTNAITATPPLLLLLLPHEMPFRFCDNISRKSKWKLFWLNKQNPIFILLEMPIGFTLIATVLHSWKNIFSADSMMQH